MPMMSLLKPLMKLLMLSDKQSRIQNRHLKRLIAALDLKRASKNNLLDPNTNYKFFKTNLYFKNYP